MKFIAFRSSKGDCILITNNSNSNNKHMLIDGGMKGSFEDHVLPYLNSQIKQKNEVIDLLCVSHIDDDHIRGVLFLMQHLAKWRAKNYYDNIGGDPYMPSLGLEPPEVKSMWHNSFAETYELPEFLSSILNSLSQIEQLTYSAQDPLLRQVHDIANNEKQGILLSQMVDPQELNIPVNEGFRGSIIKVNQSSINKNVQDIIGAKVTILGPFHGDIMKLKEQWLEFERENKTKIENYFSDFAISNSDVLFQDIHLKELFSNSGVLSLSSAIGDRDSVTIPNLASIMFLIEQDNKSILMTGDGAAQDIIKGLEKNKRLVVGGSIHVNILKIQHHGAEANITDDFCQRVTADHYIFCGNGTHHNPEISVVELIYDHRPDIGTDFTLHFNVNPEDNLTENQKKHIKELETRLEELENDNTRNDFKFKFINVNASFIEIDL